MKKLLPLFCGLILFSCQNQNADKEIPQQKSETKSSETAKTNKLIGCWVDKLDQHYHLKEDGSFTYFCSHETWKGTWKIVDNVFLAKYDDHPDPHLNHSDIIENIGDETITFNNGLVRFVWVKENCKLDTQNTMTNSKNIPVSTNHDPLEYIKKFNNKYPADVGLYENEPLKSRVKALLGDNYSSIEKNNTVQSPITLEGNIVFTHGCRAHYCGNHNCAIAIDIKNDAIFIAIINDDTINWFKENTELPSSPVLKEWAKRGQSPKSWDID